MGVLTFTNLKFDVLSKNAVYVIGKWQINRKETQIGGHYTLLWKKINGKWVIVCDHTS
jgi:ketosteroid isomerase-like protein